MAISGDYAHPVQVNGYSCKNCTDVDYAKKHIDPVRPKDGPYGVNAKNDPKSKSLTNVVFGGRLSGLSDTPIRTVPETATTGRQLDVFA